MDNDVEKYLFDALESIRVVKLHLKNVPDYSTFVNNVLVQDAVQRRLSIIGEAIWKASKLNSSIQITDLRKIVSFRHILIHEYDKLEAQTVWLVITRNLSILEEELENLLKESNGSSIN